MTKTLVSSRRLLCYLPSVLPLGKEHVDDWKTFLGADDLFGTEVPLSLLAQ